jgi:hypothetical protein
MNLGITIVIAPGWLNEEKPGAIIETENLPLEILIDQLP